MLKVETLGSRETKRYRCVVSVDGANGETTPWRSSRKVALQEGLELQEDLSQLKRLSIDDDLMKLESEDYDPMDIIHEHLMLEGDLERFSIQPA
jgi:hypothetical protein